MSEEKKKTIILYSTYCTGVGLWTSICMMFARIFGCACNSYSRKCVEAMDLLRRELIDQIKENPEYRFSDISVTSDAPLSFTGTVIGTLKD